MSGLPPSVWLVGLSGSGKSTVGPDIAARLGYEFVDLDERIERRERAPIPEIFRRRGEAAFREAEERETAVLSERRRIVVATGGGWVAGPAAAPRPHGAVRVWLRVDPETAAERLATSGEARPLLAGHEPVARLSELLDRRRAAYSEAELTVDTVGRRPERIAGLVVERLRRAGVREDASP